MTDPKPYDAPDFWESAHSDVEPGSESLGADITYVGGGLNSANARALYRLRRLAMARLLRKAGLGDNPRIFELGSGGGFWVNYFQERGPVSYRGSDLSKTSVERLEKLFPDGAFHALAENPEQAWRDIEEAGPYDLTLAVDVLYHITDDTLWDKALAKVCRVTKPGGYLVTCDYFHEQVREHPSQSHVKHRSMQTYLDRFETHGFRVLEIQPAFYLLNRIPGGPFSDQNRLRSALLRIAYANPALLRMTEWFDARITRVITPMSPACKTRFVLLQKGESAA